MKKIIINYSDDYDPLVAMTYVLQAMQQGKVSEAAGIHHYCWVNTFSNPCRKNETAVYTNRKRTEKSADSFRVMELSETR